MHFFTRLLFSLAFFAFPFSKTPAQVTLVRYAPNDTVRLDCGNCLLKVTDMAMTKGQQSVPVNLKKPVALNLLHWRYFDNIDKKYIATADEPIWTAGEQLFQTLPETELLSLHINLELTDSTARRTHIFLVLAGFTRKNLEVLPATFNFSPDTYAPFRFGAIAQIVHPDDKKETFEAVQGSFSLDRFDPKTREMEGAFEFLGNRIGVVQRCLFQGGAFQKEGAE